MGAAGLDRRQHADQPVGDYASSRQLDDQLSLAARLGYLQAQAYGEVSGLCVETSKVIAGLLRALRR